MSDGFEEQGGGDWAPTAMGRLRAEQAAARRFADAQHATATRRAYSSDWMTFCIWCAERDLTALPAAPATISTFLASQAEAGRRPATIARCLAAIRQAHARAGFDSPTRAEEVKATLKGIRRMLGVAPKQKMPATIDCLAAMLAQIPNTLARMRDRAILLLGFAGAFRRSELALLKVSDLEFRPEGLLIRIRQSKTDPEGAGQRVTVPLGS